MTDQRMNPDLIHDSLDVLEPALPERTGQVTA